MAEQAQDRHLPATERRIRKAREEGQVARSRDLSHAIVLGLGSLMLLGAAESLTRLLSHLISAALVFDFQTVASPVAMFRRIELFGWPALLLVVALGGVLSLTGVAAALLAGGWNFSTQALMPAWHKMDPLAGLGRMFGLQQLAATGKSCLLAIVLGAVAAVYFMAAFDRMAALASMPFNQALLEGATLVGIGVLWLLLPLALFALIDVPLQRLMLLRRLRMSHEEVKQEHKEVEGNQAVKGKMRARMQEMARRRMMAAVPTADLVVMNPTHYAVALKYDEAQMAAPRVVAKGTDLVAMRIRDLAREHNVPVLQAAPLARALYAHTELEQEVPAQLFAAVAQVLAWVFQLRHAGADRARLLATPPQPPVPAELDPLTAARRGAEGAGA